jgi:carbon-monoxide dehydrogenase medium subunit
MKPAPFKYIAATSLEHALALKAEYGDDAKFLAGGQSLMPAMNFRLARPAILVDINEIEELAGIRPSGGTTRVGPLTRYRTLQRDATFAQLFPLIGEALPHIARRSGVRASSDSSRATRPVPCSGGETRTMGRGI